MWNPRCSQRLPHRCHFRQQVELLSGCTNICTTNYGFRLPVWSHCQVAISRRQDIHHRNNTKFKQVCVNFNSPKSPCCFAYLAMQRGTQRCLQKVARESLSKFTLHWHVCGAALSQAMVASKSLGFAKLWEVRFKINLFVSQVRTCLICEKKSVVEGKGRSTKSRTDARLASKEQSNLELSVSSISVPGWY